MSEQLGDVSAPFTPSNHYWIVGEDESRAWSSREAAYVEADDLAYLRWRRAGGQPTSIANAYELDQVLRPYGLSLGRPFTAEEALAALTRIDGERVKAALGRDDVGSIKAGDAEKLAALAAALRPAAASNDDIPAIDNSAPVTATADALAELTARFEKREAELIAKGLLTPS